YDRALSDYNQGIALDPKYPYAYYNRGLAWEQKHDLEKALADFKKFSELDPSEPAGSEAIGRVTKVLGQPAAPQSQDRSWCFGYDQADDRTIAGCTHIIESGSATQTDLKAAYVNRGVSYKNKGDFDRAIADYNQAIALDPRDSVVYFNRGYAYSGKG